MNLVMARVDDRLVHGQVVLGCCPALGASRVMLCSDEVAADPLLARVYRAAAPPGIQVEILDREATRARLSSADDDRQPTILVAASISDLLWLVASGSPLTSVTLGGLHRRAGAREVWPGVYLTPTDLGDLRQLLGRRLRVQVQSVPGAEGFEASLPELDRRGGSS